MVAKSNPLSAFERTKLCDLLFALPLIAWFVWYIVQDFDSFGWLWPRLASGRANFALIANLLSHLATLGLAVLFIAFLILRAPPIAKRRGIAPRVVALLGSFQGVLVFALPRSFNAPWVDLLSALMIFAGSGFAIYAAAHLGRSFGIMPEARRLVTTGPFAAIRHPLYLGEGVAMAGAMLQFLQPWSFILFAIQIGWQVMRMSYEERVLSDVFPEYKVHFANKARVIPGVY